MIIELIKNHFNLSEIGDDILSRVVAYLQRYGYLKIDGKIELEEIVTAIRFAQSFMGVQENTLGPKTINQMLVAQRCGCVDIPPGGEAVTSSGFWGPDELTYYFDSFVDGLTKDQQKSIAKSCFDKASKIINLRFTEASKSQNANFILRASNSKQDGLGSANGVLAFNYLPPSPNFAGQLEGVFDLAETWIDNPPKRGILYDAVFTHEVLGHGLGLYHSNTPNQLLNPFYNPAIRELQPEDANRLIQLYGKAPNSPPQKPDNPDSPVGPISKLTLEIEGNITKFSLPGYRIQKIG